MAFYLDAAAGSLTEAPDFAAEQLGWARRLTDLTLDEARAAIAGLRPPVLDDLGLADGLASLVRSIRGVEVTVEADECRLPEHVEVALYRIAQEALQNVVKHANATRAGIELCSEQGVISLRITDDGSGFEVGAASPGDLGGGGYGLRSMAERAELVGGQLEVRSRPGHGTTVIAGIPVKAPTLPQDV